MSHKKHRKHGHQPPDKEIEASPVPESPEIGNPTNCNDGSGDGERPSFDWMRLFTGILALFAVLSFVALWVQLHDARKFFAIDQRPYVWIANETNNPEVVAPPDALGQKRVMVTMRYTNFGKSPAILIRNYHGLVLGPNSNKIKPDAWIEGKMILPAGKVDFFSALSDVVSDQEISKYSSAQVNEGITVYATWQYADTSGNRYETEICMTRLNLGAWAYCKEHNDIKNCSESPCEP